MASTIEVFIQEQSRQYQHHLAIRNKSHQVLLYQQNIRSFKTIPKQYLPQKSLQLIQSNSDLITNYHQKLQDLFLQHLNDVITHNTIILELEEAQLRQIIVNTEKHLALLPETNSVIAQHHQQFIADNNIRNHDIHPELLQRLPKIPAFLASTSSSKPPPSQNLSLTKTCKRPNPRKRGIAVKRRKTNPPPNTLPSTPPQSSPHSQNPQPFLEERLDLNFPT